MMNMDIKKVLITGDDGKSAIGTRLLVKLLKGKYELCIAETKTQQSGVGGKLHLGEEMDWGEHTIDGVKAVWVDGAPMDAVELAYVYFGRDFDLVLSGVNLGANISGGVFSSGTYAAAFRTLNIKMAPKAIVLSWDVAYDKYLLDHNTVSDIEPYIEYPGQAVNKVIKIIIKNDFWGCDFLNVNFPEKKVKETNTIKFVEPLPCLKDFYDYEHMLDRENYKFKFPKDIQLRANSPLEYDGGAVRGGYITITPCKRDILNDDEYKALKDKTIEL